MIEIRPKTLATGPNNPDKQISVTVWNAGHKLTGAPNSLIGTDGTGAATEYALEDLTPPDLSTYVTETELTTALTNYSLVGHTHVIDDVEGLQEALDAAGGGGEGYALLAGGNVFSGDQELLDDLVMTNMVATGSYIEFTGGTFWPGILWKNGIGTQTAGIYSGRDGDAALLMASNQFRFTNDVETVTYATLGSTGLAVVNQDYGPAWDGNLTVPTKNAVYDKIETVIAGIPAPPDLSGYATDAELAAGLALKVNKAGDTMTGDLLVPWEDWGAPWALSFEVPTKGAVYDEVEAFRQWVTIQLATKVDDSELGAYATDAELAAGLDLKVNKAGDTMTGALAVPDVAYGPAWDNSVAVPTRNAVYDEFETLRGAVAISINNKMPIAGGTFTGDILVPYEVYGAPWNGSYEVPTKDAIYDKIESVIASIPAAPSTVISDAVYDATWNGDTAIAPSKNAVYDQMELRYAKAGGTITGNVTISAASSALTLNPVSGTSTIDLRGTASTNDGLSLRASGGTTSFCADSTLFRNRAASVTFGTLNSTNLTMTVPIVVPDVAYAAGWDGDFSVPTKNAVYDKIQTLGAGGGVDDTAFGPSWDGVTTIAPSKNAVFDKITAMSAGGGSLTDGDYGDVVVSGSGSSMLVDANAITLAKMADVATGTVFYRKTASTGDPEVQTLATLKTDLGLTGTNSGDQTSIVGITGTLAQFNTAITDADIMPIAGGTFTGAISVPDDPYAVGWNGSVVVPTKNAVYDKIEAVIATIPAAPSTVISDTAYAASWDGVTTIAPSKNAVYDAMELKANTTMLAGYLPLTGGALSGDLAINKASPQLTLNPSSGGAVLELLGAGGVDGFRLQAIAATGNVRSDTVNITNKANSATYASFASGAITLNGKITNAATQGSVLTGVDQLQLREPGLSAGYTFKMGYLNSVGTHFTGWQGVIDAIQGGVGTVLNLNPSGGIVATGGQLRVPDDAYAAGWNGSLAVPTKNAVYDKIEAVIATIPVGGGGLTDGDKGDVVVGGSGTTMTVESAAGTFTVAGTTMWVNTDKLLVQHSAGNANIRTQSGGGNLILGAEGAGVLTVAAAGATLAGNLTLTGTGTVTAGAINATGNIALSKNYPNIFIDSTTTDGTGNERSAIQFRNHELDGWIVYSKGEAATPEFVFRPMADGVLGSTEVIRFGADGTIITVGPVQADQARFASTVNPNFILAKWTGTTPTLMQRVDSTHFYMLLSDAGSVLNGTFNALRPFQINLTSGAVTMSNGQVLGGGTILTGALTATSIAASGNITCVDGTFNRGDGTGAIFFGGTGSTYIYFNSASEFFFTHRVSVSGTFNATGAITQGGTAVSLAGHTHAFGDVQMTATSRILGRTTAGAGAVEQLTTAQVVAMLPVSPEFVTVTAQSTSLTTTNANCNNVHFVFSGAARVLTLNTTPTAGTSFTGRFTTAWTITCTSLSKNGAAPVANGTVAANSLISFVHEGAGTWVASGTGLT